MAILSGLTVASWWPGYHNQAGSQSPAKSVPAGLHAVHQHASRGQQSPKQGLRPAGVLRPGPALLLPHLKGPPCVQPPTLPTALPTQPAPWHAASRPLLLSQPGTPVSPQILGLCFLDALGALRAQVNTEGRGRASCACVHTCCVYRTICARVCSCVCVHMYVQGYLQLCVCAHVCT